MNLTELTSGRSQPLRLLLVAPLLFLGVFFFLPLLWIIYVSFGPSSNELASYYKVATTGVYGRSLLWTFELALVTTLATAILGYPVAFAMVNSGPSLKFFLLACVILPFWTSALVRTFSWIAILGRQGTLNSALTSVGLIPDPLQLVFNPLGAVIGTTHIMLPFMVLSLYANMQSIDRFLLQAAESLGAGRWRAFLLVYFPQTTPGLMSGSVLVFVISLGFFITPAVLGGTHTSTIAVLIEQSMNKLLDWPLAAALASILLIITLSFYGVFRRQIARALGRAQSTSGASSLYRSLAWIDEAFERPRRILRSLLGQRRTPRGRGFRGPGIATSLAVPIAILTAAPMVLIVLIAFFPSHSMAVDFSNFSLRWFAMYFSRAEWLNATWNSFQIALACALLTCVLALASALAVRRLTEHVKGVLIPLYLSPLIVPGVVYGLSTYFLFANMGLIGTKVSLVLAHTVLAIPAAFLLMLAGVQSLDEKLEDAAASLGATPWRQFRYIILPLLAPTAVVSALIAFLVSFDDLNVALFLASGTSKTLPKLMYDSIVFESDPRVTAASAVLVGISLAVLATMYAFRSLSSDNLQK
jgi:putative spermidine/putrescine transport system permease protein